MGHSLKILGRTSSINVRKVLWTCQELDIPYDREDWGIGFASTQSPEFLALNPNAQVPVIIDDNGVLWESNTICRYLVGLHQRHDLLLEEQLIKTGAYVAGNDFTLADILIGLSVHRWWMTPMEHPSYPAVSAYYETLSQRPGFKTFALNGHN